MRDETLPFLNSFKSSKTRENYRRWLNAFIKYCRDFHNCKTHPECKTHIQDYTDYLKKQGYTPATIHTYIAPICNLYGIPMEKINKPIRSTADIRKSRSGNAKKKADNNPDNPRYNRTVEFQKVVGIRKSELKKLQGRDLRTDESGYSCIFVKNGKGGKDTLQRILPKNIDFIKSFFEGKKPKEKIFNEKELSNSVDYYHLRAINAQNAYSYYLDKIQNEPGYKEQLISEIYLRWKLYCMDKTTKEPKPFNEKLLQGKYKVRGKNRKMAIEKGLPTEFDKLATTAVSIFHLSHWRNNVTVQNHLLSY